jgi:hypothetical protein
MAVVLRREKVSVLFLNLLLTVESLPRKKGAWEDVRALSLKERFIM